MKSKSLLPCIKRYKKTGESSPHHHVLHLQDPF